MLVQKVAFLFSGTVAHWWKFQPFHLIRRSLMRVLSFFKSHKIYPGHVSICGLCHLSISLTHLHLHRWFENKGNHERERERKGNLFSGCTHYIHWRYSPSLFIVCLPTSIDQARIYRVSLSGSSSYWFSLLKSCSHLRFQSLSLLQTLQKF